MALVRGRGSNPSADHTRPASRPVEGVGASCRKRSPVPPAAVIYARFLLAHLPEPATLVPAWAGELAPGGVLVVEEVEWIETADPVLAEYLELMAGALRARDTELYVGPLIGRLEAPAGCATVHNGVARLEPTTSQAAALFSLNLVTLRSDTAVAARRTEAELDSLADALEARRGDRHFGSITWGMRQRILTRSEPPAPAGARKFKDRCPRSSEDRATVS